MSRKRSRTWIALLVAGALALLLAVPLLKFQLRVVLSRLGPMLLLVGLLLFLLGLGGRTKRDRKP